MDSKHAPETATQHEKYHMQNYKTGRFDLVANGPLKFEKWPIEFQDFIQNTREICSVYLNLMKQNRKISIRKRLELETIVPKISD